MPPPDWIPNGGLVPEKKNMSRNQRGKPWPSCFRKPDSVSDKALTCLSILWHAFCTVPSHEHSHKLRNGNNRNRNAGPESGGNGGSKRSVIQRFERKELSHWLGITSDIAGLQRSGIELGRRESGSLVC
jgi:hypothetical protein